MTRFSLLLLCALAFAGGCVDGLLPAGAGEVYVIATGGDEAAAGLPASAVSDGWRVVFDDLVVGFATLRTTAVVDGAVPIDRAPDIAIDLTTADEFTLIDGEPFETGPWVVDFGIGPPTLSGRGVGLEEGDLAQMQQGGQGVRLAGRAERGGDVVPFDLTFPLRAALTDCGADDEVSFTVVGGETLAVFLRADVRRLFRTRLDDDEAPLRFDAWAGAEDPQFGAVTNTSLRGVSLSTLPGYDGGETGAVTLYDFVQQAAGRMFRFENEDCAVSLGGLVAPTAND